MMNKILSASLIAFFAAAGLAQAQVAIGTPITPENRSDPAPTNCAKVSHPILGNIARTVMAPLRAAAGCLMPPAPYVPGPTREEVARMTSDGGYSPAEITAAKIKVDENQSRARCAAVKYLASVDLHYYHEAEAGLVAALRADRVEAVRLEAALALGECRGVTVRMLDALNLAALGLDTDGNPAETAETVRAAAANSLNRCLTRGIGNTPAALAQGAPSGQQFTAAPSPIQAVTYFEPNAASPVLPEERLRAGTVSASPISAPPAPPRSLYQSWLNFTSPPDSARSRMRGLTPLGSEAALAIPVASPSPPAILAPVPYNNN